MPHFLIQSNELTRAEEAAEGDGRVDKGDARPAEGGAQAEGDSYA